MDLSIRFLFARQTGNDVAYTSGEVCEYEQAELIAQYMLERMDRNYTKVILQWKRP